MRRKSLSQLGVGHVVAGHWDTLHMGWTVDRANHSECYSDHGKHTNMAESYFSRLRRMCSSAST